MTHDYTVSENKPCVKYIITDDSGEKKKKMNSAPSWSGWIEEEL